MLLKTFLYKSPNTWYFSHQLRVPSLCNHNKYWVNLPFQFWFWFLSPVECTTPANIQVNAVRLQLFTFTICKKKRKKKQINALRTITWILFFCTKQLLICLGLVVKIAIADMVWLGSKRAFFSPQTNPVPSTLNPLANTLYLYSVLWTHIYKCTLPPYPVP